MATLTGKAARRKWGTKANAKRAHRHKAKNFASSPQEKADYRQAKRLKKLARRRGA